MFNFFLFSRIIFSFNDKKLITIAASFEKFTYIKYKINNYFEGLYHKLKIHKIFK